MTETANGPARSTTGKKSGAKGGIKVERVFSTEGVHPYDELKWERRDVVQTNWKTGETVFEQKGVEFPRRGRSTPRRSSPPSTSVARSAPTPASGASSSSSTGS